MDFGDILDQWDREQAKPALKKAGASATGLEPIAPLGVNPGREAPRPDPLSAWLRANGVVDKDAGTEESAAHPSERRRRRIAKKADASLDLHGLTRDEAWIAMENFFRAGRQQGFDKLLIVHGKGNHTNGEAVLKRAVRDFIESCAYAGESGHGTAVEGGNGATWVLLKAIE
jgi:DNA-nicking Smr family endonuclease